MKKKQTNNKNKILFSPSSTTSVVKKISNTELILIFLVILIFGYSIFSLISQVYSLNLELKNLVALVQSLQENQINLKTQLSTKDQEIKLLENTINSMSTSSLTAFDENQSLELLKKEIIKNNIETSQFFLKTGSVALGAFFVFKLIKFFL